MAKFEWNITSRISNLLESKELTDVTFQVGQPPESFSCHKLILASGSEVFKTMFYGQLPETSPITVPDITPRAFHALIQLFYTDKYDIRSESEAFEIAYASKKYMLPSLHLICENYLISQLRLFRENACAIFEQADLLDMSNLKVKSLYFIAINFLPIFRQRGSCPEVSQLTMSELLSLDILDVNSEREVLEVLCDWCLKLSETKNILPEKCLKDAIQHIRFHLISTDELDDVAERYEFFRGNVDIPLQKLFNKSMVLRSTVWFDNIEILSQYRFNDSNLKYRFLTNQRFVEIRVLRGQLIVVGVITSMRPIIEYSRDHRSLSLRICFKNFSNNSESRAISTLKLTSDEGKEYKNKVMLEEPLVISDGEYAQLNVSMDCEGILLPRLVQEKITKCLNKTTVLLSVINCCKLEDLFTVKEILCVFK